MAINGCKVTAWRENSSRPAKPDMESKDKAWSLLCTAFQIRLAVDPTELQRGMRESAAVDWGFERRQWVGVAQQRRTDRRGMRRLDSGQFL